MVGMEKILSKPFQRYPHVSAVEPRDSFPCLSENEKFGMNITVLMHLIFMDFLLGCNSRVLIHV